MQIPTCWDTYITKKYSERHVNCSDNRRLQRRCLAMSHSYSRITRHINHLVAVIGDI